MYDYNHDQDEGVDACYPTCMSHESLYCLQRYQTSNRQELLLVVHALGLAVHGFETVTV